jgi:ERCC4-type nuclease
MKLKVDSREIKVIDLLEQSELEYETENLNIGDFLFLDSNDIPVCLVERKTLDDLSSSIVDSRFREQKDRISQSNIPIIIYLIESKDGIKANRLSEKILLGSIVNLIVNHKFYVLQSNGLKQTCDIIIDLFKKLEKIQDNKINVYQYTNPKKSDDLEKDLFTHQLSLIPRLTFKNAKKITEIYPTFKCLYEEYNKCNDKKINKNLLANIKLENDRKLGEKMSIKVYNSVFL